MSGKTFLTLIEVQMEFNLGEKFITEWTAPKAEQEWKEGRSSIPAMPVVRPGERGMIFPRQLLEQWLLKYFGSGYTGDEKPVRGRAQV
jgi:hypothetical protein